ncbi:NAD(P)-binding domain-containing protein [Halobacteriovorax sp. GB3]|uniref:NAD(P)-binding domain-containing protein n=1 Tax=Halobacteriovorax sp. GB3 TaxID=2719615 RepID=UPI0023620FA5|nr:NAD(P)-binding domain-containing protein [Halobacteriovorax sp. GB3]MDD0854072.1 NAD(P)-binding domain-containing protein [Halobacteriovorax sp. GB3]
MNTDQVAIIGLGSQAKAWALNLKDSGRDVFIILRDKSPSHELARSMGLKTLSFEDELNSFDLIVMLTPDHIQYDLLKSYSHKFKNQATFVYAHGWSPIRGVLKDFPNFSHTLLAPKAIASEVRFQYETKGKLGAAFCTKHAHNPNEAKEIIIKLAKDLGITAGPYESTFEEETKADLFSEQTLLCSLLPYGALLSYNALRKSGVSKEVAFMECWLEVKLIADALVKMGPIEFFQLISPNALAGANKARQVLFDKEYRHKLDSLLHDIESGDFYRECENTNHQKLREEVLEQWRSQELCSVFEELKDELIP